jgi:hypothetical protein
MWTTVVDPTEYDIESDMKRMIKLSNENKECYTAMDIGKVVGLYLSWKNKEKPQLKENVKK